MKILIQILAVCLFMTQGTVVAAQSNTRAAAPQPSAARENVASQPTCAMLLGRYNDENKELSAIWADGLFDNSAPRETNRGLQELNSRLIQQMAVQMLISKQCPLPTQSSGYIFYSMAAMDCRTARREQPSTTSGSPAACEKSSWRSITEAAASK
jgi:hypothetical protein